jgi:integrase
MEHCMSVERIRLTPAFIASVKAPESGRLEFADTECAGLYLRVSEHGTKSFTCVFWQGKTIRVTLGKSPAWSLQAARKECRKLAADVAAGIDVSAREEADRSMLTLGELFDAYARNRLDAKKRSMAETRQMFERHLGRITGERKKCGQQRTKPAGSVDWHSRRIDKITQRDVEMLRERMRGQGLSDATCNRLIGTLRAMYVFAKNKKFYTGANPTDGIEHGTTVERTRFLQASELPAFMAALAATPQPWRDYFTLLLTIGFRRAAVAAMRWEHIDLVNGKWDVPAASSKNKQELSLPLVGEALVILRRRQADASSPFVFPGGSAAGCISNPKPQWKALLQRAGLKDLRLHDLRRTLGSWAAMSGFSLHQIGKMLGHSSTASTKIYARLELGAVAAVAAKAQEQMFSHGNVVPITRRA